MRLASCVADPRDGRQAAALFVVQALVGVVVGRQPGQRVLGVNRAKSLWKWHRASGESALLLLAKF